LSIWDVVQQGWKIKTSLLHALCCGAACLVLG